MLAKLTGKSKATISKCVKRLRGTELVKRSRSGRTYECSLTQKGEELLSTLANVTR